MLLERFAREMKSDDIVGKLRSGLIGERIQIEGPTGCRELVYADYTASGRALQQVEDFIAENVLPFYANSHTESSYCGAFTTNLREEARALIAAHTNAGDDCSIIFSGSGATSAVNRMVALCGLHDLVQQADEAPAGLKKLFMRKADQKTRPVVLVGPYEHHSNLLPWRESGAEVIEVPEGVDGGPDLTELENTLKACQGKSMIVGAFSAASNVTGIVTDTNSVTLLLKKYGALAFWDYAGGGPYLPMDMNPGPGLEKDAIFLSPHKFVGGPGASGVLILRNDVVKIKRPTAPGGGSVSYVSSWAHDYLDSIIEREEAGTPNVIGDIRVALVFIIKAAIGTEFIRQRDAELVTRAFEVWSKNPNIDILAPASRKRLPIFSFTMHDGKNSIIHHEQVTKILSDNYGIQARGGCACAGPYGHRLLGVEKSLSEQIRRSIASGQDVDKPGWTRLNLSYLMDDKTADFIIESVDDMARNSSGFCN